MEFATVTVHRPPLSGPAPTQPAHTVQNTFYFMKVISYTYHS